MFAGYLEGMFLLMIFVIPTGAFGLYQYFNAQKEKTRKALPVTEDDMQRLVGRRISIAFKNSDRVYKGILGTPNKKAGVFTLNKNSFKLKNVRMIEVI